MAETRRRRGSRAVTLHEVADVAGVSPMTVSRVIGASSSVSEKTRKKVEAAIERTGYSPNAAARTLASGNAIRIGVLYGNPSAGYMSELLVSLFECSSRLGCELMLEKCVDPETLQTSADRLLSAGIDGVILPTPLCENLLLISRFEAAGIPALAFGTGRSDAKSLSVWIDNAGAAAEMTRYLISLGHRDIGFIRGHPAQIDSNLRYEGFATAMREAGILVLPNHIAEGDYSYRSGVAAAEQILSDSRRPTAIFASNDDMAAGALATAHRLKIDVPLELSIAGFDDTTLATTIWPSLTTIRQPIAEMIEQGLELLVKDIRCRRKGKSSVLLQTGKRLTLVIRESVSAIIA